MQKHMASLIVCGLLWLQASTLLSQPISLHPENPHYFLFRGRPTVLVTSAEHYGAVLNLDFDYVAYLEELQAAGLNHTRLFSGSYVEPPGAFNIAGNTLAPAPGRYVCPWARSDTPGYANGGNKFDLRRFDPAYFRRLRDFMMEASKRGVVVEMNLFCPFYEETQWRIAPQNPYNNSGGIGPLDRTHVYTLDRNGGLLAVHDALVRKIVGELKDFDNLYYEICNEPYFGGVTLEWQAHIAEEIAAAEQGFSDRHLISQNIANLSARVERPHAAVSILNFHYATPPDAVALNYDHNRVIGDNETGFRGVQDFPYRREAWEFMIAGGGLFNHLDYSFSPGHERGTFAYPATQPGGGNQGFRSQMKILKDFLEGFDFVRMKPEEALIRAGVPARMRARALVQPGRAYAVYLTPGLKDPLPAALGQSRIVFLQLDLPPGRYLAEWISPVSGRIERAEGFQHRGGLRRLKSPKFAPDIALRILAK